MAVKLKLCPEQITLELAEATIDVGIGLTVTITVFELVHPLMSEAFTVNVVVDVGVATTEDPVPKLFDHV